MDFHVSHDELSEIWQKYGGGYVWIRSIDSNINALRYILRYVNKTIRDRDRTYAAILFVSNKRIFSMSQNLLAKLNIKRNHRSQGKFEGTIDESNLKNFCREEEIVFDDFVRVRATFQLMHEYTKLFGVWDDG